MQGVFLELELAAWKNPSRPIPKSVQTQQEKEHNGEGWIRDIAHNLNNELLAEFFCLWGEIQSAQLNLEDERDDEIIWVL